MLVNSFGWLSRGLISANVKLTKATTMAFCVLYNSGLTETLLTENAFWMV